MTLHRTHYLGYQNLDLCADSGGDPENPTVIFLHGGGQTRHSWGKAARDLVRTGYHVIVLDLRGHGESGWSPDGDYSTNAFVLDLKAVIATLDRPPALVGASLGGITSLLAIGESDNQLARALVLVDVVPRMSAAGVKHIGDFMRGNPNGFADLKEAADAVARYIPNRPRPSSPEGLLKNLRLKDDGRYYWHWDPAFQARTRQNIGNDLFSRMESAARNVRTPTLLVRGKQSDVVSEEGAQLLLELIPHAEYINVEGAGHMVAGDRNDQFNGAIIEFLDKTLKPC